MENINSNEKSSSSSKDENNYDKQRISKKCDHKKFINEDKKYN